MGKMRTRVREWLSMRADPDWDDRRYRGEGFLRVFWAHAWKGWGPDPVRLAVVAVVCIVGASASFARADYAAALALGGVGVALLAGAVMFIVRLKREYDRRVHL